MTVLISDLGNVSLRCSVSAQSGRNVRVFLPPPHHAFVMTITKEAGIKVVAYAF